MAGQLRRRERWSSTSPWVRTPRLASTPQRAVASLSRRLFFRRAFSQGPLGRSHTHRCPTHRCGHRHRCRPHDHLLARCHRRLLQRHRVYGQLHLLKCWTWSKLRLQLPEVGGKGEEPRGHRCPAAPVPTERRHPQNHQGRSGDPHHFCSKIWACGEARKIRPLVWWV